MIELADTPERERPQERPAPGARGSSHTVVRYPLDPQPPGQRPCQQQPRVADQPLLIEADRDLIQARAALDYFRAIVHHSGDVLTGPRLPHTTAEKPCSGGPVPGGARGSTLARGSVLRLLCRGSRRSTALRVVSRLGDSVLLNADVGDNVSRVGPSNPHISSERSWAAHGGSPLAGLMGHAFWTGMSLRVVGALSRDPHDLARRPVWAGEQELAARRGTRETRTWGWRWSNEVPLRRFGRRLDVGVG